MLSIVPKVSGQGPTFVEFTLVSKLVYECEGDCDNIQQFEEKLNEYLNLSAVNYNNEFLVNYKEC